MAKKSRRARARQRAAAGRASKIAEARQPESHKSIAEAKTSAPLVQPSSTTVSAARYQYVLSDLKRIAIIAGALILVLVILTFILG